MLGTAFVLGGPLQLDELWLETGAGVVPVRLEREGSRIVFGWMRQPPFPFEPYDRAEELLALLGVEESGLPVELYRQGPGHVLIELGSPEAVAALRPDFGALLELNPYGTGCFARDGERWKARVFVPAHGVPEDSATGSAAGPLALHLARHGRIGFGDEIEIRQGVEIGRPSTLYAVARSPEEVEVGGSAVVVARGEFRLDAARGRHRAVVLGKTTDCPQARRAPRRPAHRAGRPSPRSRLAGGVGRGVPDARSRGLRRSPRRLGRRRQLPLQARPARSRARRHRSDRSSRRSRSALWRSLRRTVGRTITREELWNGNREQLRQLLYGLLDPVVGTADAPALRSSRCRSASAGIHSLDVVHLRSADEIERFLQSIQPIESMSGSSNGSERQKTPPLAET